MHGVTGRARLIWGFSDGEILWCVLLCAVLLAIYIAQVAVIFPKIAETEALSLAARNKVYWAEQWAVDGVDARAAPLIRPASEGKYLSSIEGEPGDGSMSFRFNGRMPAIDGGILTIRPALSANSMIWLCAGKPAPRGFTVRGKDLTDIPYELLNVSCRAPRL